MSNPMMRRAEAAQKTLDVWSQRPLKLGTADCVRMAAAHLRLLGRKVKLPSSGSYRTVRSATKALRAAGHASLRDAVSAQGLAEIAPAEAIVGDLMLMPSVDDLGGLGVCLGNGRVLIYHEEIDTGAVVAQPIEMVTAWRVEPLK
jgi:hypothetical protein